MTRGPASSDADSNHRLARATLIAWSSTSSSSLRMASIEILIPYYLHPFKSEIEAAIGELQRPVRAQLESSPRAAALEDGEPTGRVRKGCCGRFAGARCGVGRAFPHPAARPSARDKQCSLGGRRARWVEAAVRQPQTAPAGVAGAGPAPPPAAAAAAAPPRRSGD